MSHATDATPPMGTATVAADRPEPAVDRLLSILRPIALVVSIISALGTVQLLSLMIVSFGAYALPLTLGLLGGATAVTVALRGFALRREPVRQRRFRWYAGLELVVVIVVLGEAMVFRQPDMIPLFAGLAVLVLGLSAAQVWLLWRPDHAVV